MCLIGWCLAAIGSDGMLCNNVDTWKGGRSGIIRNVMSPEHCLEYLSFHDISLAVLPPPHASITPPPPSLTSTLIMPAISHDTPSQSVGSAPTHRTYYHPHHPCHARHRRAYDDGAFVSADDVSSPHHPPPRLYPSPALSLENAHAAESTPCYVCPIGPLHSTCPRVFLFVHIPLRGHAHARHDTAETCDGVFSHAAPSQY
jgi:hypothetical protein